MSNTMGLDVPENRYVDRIEGLSYHSGNTLYFSSEIFRLKCV